MSGPRRLVLAVAAVAIASGTVLGTAAVTPVPAVQVVSWDEPNVAMPGGFEHLCGVRSLMPAGAVRVTSGCHL